MSLVKLKRDRRPPSERQGIFHCILNLRLLYAQLKPKRAYSISHIIHLTAFFHCRFLLFFDNFVKFNFRFLFFFTCKVPLRLKTSWDHLTDTYWLLFGEQKDVARSWHHETPKNTLVVESLLQTHRSGWCSVHTLPFPGSYKWVQTEPLQDNISSIVNPRTSNNSNMNQATQHYDWKQSCFSLQTLLPLAMHIYFKQLFRNCERILITSGNCTWQADWLNKCFWKYPHLWLPYIAVVALHCTYWLQFFFFKFEKLNTSTRQRHWHYWPT